jgi:hypothetical protein
MSAEFGVLDELGVRTIPHVGQLDGTIASSWIPQI